MSSLRRVLGVVAALSILVFQQVAFSGVASATDAVCDTTPTHQFVGGFWQPTTGNFAAGIEAPVQVRTSSRVCVALPGFEADAVSAWIALEPDNGSLIVQMGFAKFVINQITGAAQLCRFWAIGKGQIHAYGACEPNSGDFVWFRITAKPDPDTGQGHFYYLQDCGTDGGYDGCVTKNAAQPAWGDAWAPELSEVSYPCGDQIMGGPSAKENIGTVTYPIKGQNSFGGTWALRGMSEFPNGHCSGHYNEFTSDTFIQTWDDRN